MRSSDNNAGRLIGGLFLIGIGVLALFGNILNFDTWHYLWPFFIIAFGLAFFVGMFIGGKSVGGLAIPGTLFTMTGLLLLFQNTFGFWESWAYAWALIAPGGVGIGLLIFARWSDKPELIRPGRILILIGLLIFIIGGALFEFSFGILSFTHGGAYLGPLVLILIGVLLLLGRGFSWLVGPEYKPSTSSIPTPPAVATPPPSASQER